MKQLKKIVCISVIFLVILASYINIMKLWNKNVIQDFLTQHFNRAVAIGITTSFEPYLLFPIDIFQSNMNELKTFCNENGYAPNSLDSCLKYLMHELDTTHKNLKTKL